MESTSIVMSPLPLLLVLGVISSGAAVYPPMARAQVESPTVAGAISDGPSSRFVIGNMEVQVFDDARNLLYEKTPTKWSSMTYSYLRPIKVLNPAAVPLGTHVFVTFDVEMLAIDDGALFKGVRSQWNANSR